jgi:hypothetical protein
MPPPHNFEHLPLVLRYQGRARLRGGGDQSQQTRDNRNTPQAHSASLQRSAEALGTAWQERQAEREQENLPVIPQGVPFLLQVDPSLDLDVLRDKFDFEIVAEQEAGYVIVAAEDIDLVPFLQMVDAFAGQIRGSATIAQIHRLYEDPTDRLSYILSDQLLADWPKIADEQVYLVDIGIACTGIREIPAPPKRGKRDTDATWAKKEHDWSQLRIEAYEAWDEIKRTRETEIEEFVNFYHGRIHHVVDGNALVTAILPDSFTVRLEIVGLGLKDFVLNYLYVFEVVEPDDISLPQYAGVIDEEPEAGPIPMPPVAGAPTVCVIDSGIQEAHLLIQPAIDHSTSRCFLPGRDADDVGDFVPPNGHGTRVAGAVLYGETVVKEGQPQLPFWIQNARVLDENNIMPTALFPAELIRAVIDRYHNGPRNTRIFNHSINASSFCRIRHMSAWAAEIDLLCTEYDILLVQSAGNLAITAVVPQAGVRDHLIAGRTYPAYLYEASARIANPGQSLQALTVGSIAYGNFESGPWTTFALERGYPSAFSRSGFGIWNVIKPEVVEFGGDDVHTNNVPFDVQGGGQIEAACPELVRSTVSPGPLSSRDETGTSFAAPKVTRIAAQLQQLLPEEPALLYRALIVQSARWPLWAESLLTQISQLDPARDQNQRQELFSQVLNVVRSIGYGLPNEERATGNTDYHTTFITTGETPIHARECHIYQVPIPPELQGQADEYDIRVEVTLSYAAQPRRTRRNLRRYLSTWVDWKSSRLWEELNHFRARALRDEENEADAMAGAVLPWVFQEKSDAGYIRGVRRNSGTVQKDWAIVKSNDLPNQFCIAVVGHEGWSHDPDSTARYALAVTFEILGQEIPIYEPLRTAVIELQAEVEAETVADLEAEAEIEIEG